MVKQHLSFLKVAVEGAFQSFGFRGNEGIMSKMGVSDGIVVECVFEKGDGCIVKDEVGEFMGCFVVVWSFILQSMGISYFRMIRGLRSVIL